MTRARASLAALAVALGTAVAAHGCKFVKSRVEVDSPQLEAAGKLIKEMRTDLTPENEYYVGRAVATNLLAKHDYRYVGADAIAAGDLDVTTQYVNQVGQILVASAYAGEGRKDDRPAPLAGWHFIIIEADPVNAIAAPGGFVFITTGALRLAESEDELAAVLAHEIAHVIRGHALGTIKKARYASLSKDLLDSTVQLSGEQIGQLTEVLDGSIDDMLDSLLVKGYSKDTEYGADRLGLEIAMRAGYEPGAMIAYLRRLESVQDTGGGGWKATHPKASARIKKLEKKLKGKQLEPHVPEVRRTRFAAAVEGL